MSTLEHDFADALNEASALAASSRAVERLLKTIGKKAEKNERTLRKKLDTALKKKSRKSGGVSAPVSLSEELCEFLDVPFGSQAARTEVTRQLNGYIKENDLQLLTDRTLIAPDEKLTQLLGTSASVSFFSLQGYMNRHFSTC
jgi:chromatin remodeling complex protein RSC6